MNAEAYRWAALSGLGSLIPVPFVDVWAQSHARRRAVRAAARGCGVELDPASVHALAAPYEGVLSGCVTGLLWWPIKKVFKTILVFLTVEDVIVGMARAVVQADLVAIAAREGHLPSRTPAVAKAIGGAVEVIGSPVRRRLRRQPSPEPVPALETRAPGVDGALARALAVVHREAGGALARERFRVGE